VTIRPGQLKDREGIHDLAVRALRASDRAGEVDSDVLNATILTALTSPQYCILVSGDRDEIKGSVCGIIAPSFYGKFMTATDIFLYSEDGSGYWLYKGFLQWAESFNLVKQIHFSNSFKVDGDDRQLDTMMKRMKFQSTGRHYQKVAA